MTGDRGADQIRRPLRSLLAKGVDLRLTRVEGMDLPGRKVVTGAGELRFEYLVIALGAELAPESIPGLAQASETFYTAEGAARLREKLGSLQGGRIATVVAATPYKCPAAPHEGAMLIADYFQRRGLRDKVEIHLFTPEGQPMPVAGPELGQAVTQLLKSKGVEFHPLHALTEVNVAARTLVFQQGTVGPYDLIVAVPPHRAPKAVQQTGIENPAGWIPVNPHTLETSVERVFAIGDIAAVPIPGRWKPDVPLMLPKAGVFAHVQAEVAAARIADEIEGRVPKDTFTGHGYCMLEAGEHAAGFAAGDFFAKPAPQVHMRQAGRAWHIGKVLFEKYWLARPGWKRELYAAALKTGARVYGIPVAV
jgi:sulfide:quinone oxidoreductase